MIYPFTHSGYSWYSLPSSSSAIFVTAFPAAPQGLVVNHRPREYRKVGDGEYYFS
jgi:hypothetical protein